MRSLPHVRIPRWLLRHTSYRCRNFLQGLGDDCTLAPLSLIGARQPFGSLRSALRRVRASLFPGAVTPALRRN